MNKPFDIDELVKKWYAIATVDIGSSTHVAMPVIELMYLLATIKDQKKIIDG